MIKGRSEYVVECGKQRHSLTCPQAVTVNINSLVMLKPGAKILMQLARFSYTVCMTFSYLCSAETGLLQITLIA